MADILDFLDVAISFIYSWRLYLPTIAGIVLLCLSLIFIQPIALGAGLGIVMFGFWLWIGIRWQRSARGSLA